MHADQGKCLNVKYKLCATINVNLTYQYHNNWRIGLIGLIGFNMIILYHQNQNTCKHFLFIVYNLGTLDEIQIVCEGLDLNPSSLRQELLARKN
jgi:hypothetical protein